MSRRRTVRLALHQGQVIRRANQVLHGSDLHGSRGTPFQKCHLPRVQLHLRSLKPENVLLDKKGYIKLTDFGLSKALLYEDEKTMSICGTPEYLAPEVIRKQGHNKAVDWWCLGCIIYEMVTGFPPFRNQNRMELFESIIYKPLHIPGVIILSLRFLPNFRIFSADFCKRTRGTD